MRSKLKSSIALGERAGRERDTVCIIKDEKRSVQHVGCGSGMELESIVDVLDCVGRNKTRRSFYFVLVGP